MHRHSLSALIVLLALLLPALAQAYDVLVLVSRRDSAYEEVLRGFRGTRMLTDRVVFLTDYAEADITRVVREDRPRMVLAMGDSALAAVRRIRQVPIAAVMSLAIRERRNALPNLAGIDMFAPPETYLELFREMKKHRVGVLYDPAKSGWYLRRAQQLAHQYGIRLVVRETPSPRDTLDRLAGLKGQVDAIWMLPDTTAVTRETAEAYFVFSQEEQVPVVSFAGAYLTLGAAAAVEIDRIALGRQAADLCSRALHGSDIADLAFTWPHKTTIRNNGSVLKRLGIDVGSLGK
ncbi:MAG TPA: ABC transporter substrate binding protein [Desulfuromonadaceae bacterium]